MFSKIYRVVPLPQIKSTTVAPAFLNHWVYTYGVPLYVLTDNSPQVASKFFAAVCQLLGSTLYFTTAYHPQTNGQGKRYNKTIVQRLRHYVSENQRYWGRFGEPLTYAYNTQVHRTIGTTLFNVALTRHPPLYPCGLGPFG